MTDPHLTMQTSPPAARSDKSDGIGPLVIASLATAGVALILLLIALLLPLIKATDRYRYDSSTPYHTSTYVYDAFDFGAVLPIVALLAMGLVVAATMTRGRWHMATRGLGGATALVAMISVIGVWRSIARYVEAQTSTDDTWQLHLQAGWFLALAAAFLLLIAVALAQHLPSRPVAQPLVYPMPQYQAQPQQPQPQPQAPAQPPQQPQYPQYQQQWPPQ